MFQVVSFDNLEEEDPIKTTAGKQDTNNSAWKILLSFFIEAVFDLVII